MSERYIDADALRATMYHQAFETDTPLQKWDSGCWIRYKMFEDAIEAAPTIDAAPIVKGEWIDIDSESIKCSVDWCGYIGHPKWAHNFCPNCGAAMTQEAVSILRERSGTDCEKDVFDR